MKLKNHLFYGWVIVAAGFFVFTIAYGVRVSFSVMFPSLLEQFGWPRDATAAILSFHLLAYGITAPISGALVDRLGVKRNMSLGVILLGVGAAFCGLSNELWQCYIAFGLLMGVGLCLMGTVPFTRIISSWFINKRGLALSIIFTGMGGGFMLYPLVALLIERLSWRGAFFVEAAMVLGLLLPIIFFLIRRYPEEMGCVADGGVSATARTDVKSVVIVDPEWANTEWTLRKAVKKFRFWALLFSSFAVWGIANNMMIGHHVAFAEDLGFSNLYASSVLSLFGVLMIAGSLAGFISDRIGREYALTIGVVVALSGLIVLLLMKDASHPWMLYMYSILYGFGFGITSPTIAAAATDMFQGARAGPVIGSLWFAFGMGGAVGPWLGGLIFERSGSYLPAFSLAGAMLLLGCAALWVAAPRKVRVIARRAIPQPSA